MWTFSLESTDGRKKSADPTERIEQREIDPSVYSLSSSAKMIDESPQETNEIDLDYGNTDFSDLDDELVSDQITDVTQDIDEN